MSIRRRRAAGALLALVIAAVSAPPVAAEPAAGPAAERVAILLTDWAEPQGFDPLYRREVVKRSFGASATRPDEPCTDDFLGTAPFRVQLGLQPYAIGFKAKGFEGA